MIALGSDQAGYELKQVVMRHLEERGLSYKDYGSYSPDPVDYPVYGKKISTIFSASPGPTTLAPKAKMLASLCSLVASALKQSLHTAARIPGTLFAAIEIPMPVPQIKIPLSHSPSTMACATFFPYTG